VLRTLARPVLIYGKRFHLSSQASIGFIQGFPHASSISTIAYQPRWWYIRCMGDSPDVRKFLTDIGRRGGQARAKALSADQRKAIARKGAKASAKARKQKAKKKS
jgi:hypothetical protein